MNINIIIAILCGLLTFFVIVSVKLYVSKCQLDTMMRMLMELTDQLFEEVFNDAPSQISFKDKDGKEITMCKETIMSKKQRKAEKDDEMRS